MTSDDSDNDVRLTKEIEAKYLPKRAGKKALQAAYKRLSEGLDTGDITEQQYNALMGRMDEWEGKVSAMAERGRNAAAGRELAYAKYEEFFDIMRSADRSSAPYNHSKLITLANLLDEVAQEYPDFSPDLLPWREYGEEGYAYLSTGYGGKIEDSRIGRIKDEIRSRYPQKAESMTEKQFQGAIEHADEEYYQGIKEDPLTFISRATLEQIIGDPQAMEIVIQALADDGAVQEWRAEGYGEYIDKLMDVLGRDVSQERDKRAQGAAKIREVSMFGLERDKEQEANRAIEEQMDAQARLQADYTARAMKSAMREVLAGMADRLERVEEGQESLANVLEEIKTRGAGARPNIGGRLDKIANDLAEMTARAQSGDEIRSFAIAEKALWEGTEIEVSRSYRQIKCLVCGEEYYPWNIETQEGFKKFPYWFSKNVAATFWATCENCHYTGWSVWLGRYVWAGSAWRKDDLSRDPRAIWRKLGVLARHFPSQAWVEADIGGRIVWQVISTRDSRPDAVELTKLLMSEGEEDVSLVGPFPPVKSQSIQAYPTIGQFLYDMIISPRKDGSAATHLPRKWLIRELQFAHRQRTGYSPSGDEISMAIDGNQFDGAEL